MSVFSTLHSQVNNVVYFSRLFEPRKVAKNLLTLPRDYVLPSGWAAPPMVINLLVASRCNLRCGFCSADDMMNQKQREMTPADIERLVREVLPFRPSFFMGGGEPFLRRDIMDVIGAITGHGLRLGVVTNGLLVTPERGALAKQMGLGSIIFSIHGTEDVHDTVVKAKGAFRKATENIRAFCQGPRKTSVMMNLVLQQENLDSVFDLVEQGRALGVDRVRVEHLIFITAKEVNDHAAAVHNQFPAHMHTKMDVTTYRRDTAYEPSHAARLVGILHQLKERYGSFVFVKPWLDDSEIGEWYEEDYEGQRRCLFVWRSLFIDPAGNVVPCQSYENMKMGNVVREPILEIWNCRRYRAVRRLIREQRLPGCSRCCKL